MATEGSLTSWLMVMVDPLVKKGLAAVGLGWVTFEGVTGLLDQVRNSVMAGWSTMAPTVYDILALAGFLDAVGIILGSMATIAGLATMSRLGKMIA